MVMAVVTGGAIAVVAVIITDGVEVAAITMVGGITGGNVQEAASVGGLFQF
jgi:hypothetical protein